MSTWYTGGIEAFNNLANAWTGGNYLYCSVLEGTSISTASKSYNTLSQLMSALGNPNYLGNEVLLDPIANIEFDASNRLYLLRFQNQLNFGPVTQGTDMAGVVYYSGINGRADEASATVWASQESYAPAQGGDVKFGTNTDNIALYLECVKTPLSGGGPNTNTPFRGTIEAIRSLSNYWSAGTDYGLGYALVSSTTTTDPDPDWEFMSDLSSGGVQYVSGGDPADTPVTTPSIHRQTPAFDGNVYDYNLWSETLRTPVEWPVASLTPGQTISAVVVFVYNTTAAYDSSTARPIHWDNVTDYPIDGTKDVIYMQSGNVTINSIQMM